MAQSLEEYTAQAVQAYQPAKTAIQTQLGALGSNLAAGEERINKNYQQQQAQLESQRNQAAEASSLAAAGAGGSFGGAGNLARRKYYEQTFVPAQTQLQTNQANDLSALRQNYENQRTNLNAQLANLDATANQQALQQYWSAQEAERARAAQAAAANAEYQYLMNALKNQQNQVSRRDVGFVDWVNNYSNYNDADKRKLINVWNLNDNNAMNRLLKNALLTSNQYKAYQNWSNS